MTVKKPDYLYNGALCPCPRGGVKNCPRYRNCEACLANHHSKETEPCAACERKALEEFGTLDFEE